MIDRKQKKTSLGDYVVWIDTDGEPEKGCAVSENNKPMYLTVFEAGDGPFPKNEPVYGIGVAVVRCGLRKKPTTREPPLKDDTKQRDAEIESLTP